MPSLLVLSEPEVRAWLDYPGCVTAMRTALTALAAGQAEQPLRTMLAPAAAPGLMGLMPAYAAATGNAPAAYGLKAITITPENPKAGLDAHQGVVLLSNGQTGEPRALLNASAVTEIRTAAVSVLATGLLARPGASRLAVVGTGVQARAHVRAFSRAWPVTDIRVAGRGPGRAEAFAAEMTQDPAAAGPRISPADTVAEAVADADIVVTATSSSVPVLRRDWIRPGSHINAVGACLPSARELDGAIVAQSLLFADRRESLLAEAGDYRLALAEGLIGPDHLRAELGELLTEAAAGRSADEEITVFKSLGLAVEDLAAAALACRRAEAAGAGQRVQW